jgi:hypothetical protein
MAQTAVKAGNLNATTRNAITAVGGWLLMQDDF